MVEAVVIQDKVLQLLKRTQKAFYKKAYGRLERERLEFKARGGEYPSYPPMGEVNSILIYKPDDIGDAVYSLPALLHLRKKFPDKKLYLLCQDKTKRLFERTKLFDQVVGVQIKTRFLRFQRFDLERALDLFPLEKFDLAVFLRTYPGFYSQFRRLKARYKVLPLDPRLKTDSPYTAYVTPRAHQSTQMMEIVQRIIKDSSASLEFPTFAWKEEDKRALEKVFGSKIPERYLVVHPYARFETRRYPYEYWRDVLFELKKSLSTSLVIVGGKEDKPLEMEGILEAQGKLDLSETGFLISQSDGFIGNESGPAHWAAMLGIPTVMVMSGHSHLSEWGPLGKHLVLRKTVPCENCYLRACPKYKVRCLTEMDPPSVFTPAIEFFKKQFRE